MYWPSFEFDKVMNDAWRRNKHTGKIEHLYLWSSVHRYAGQGIIKSIVQEWPEDLLEGPNKAGSGKDQEWNPDEE